MSVSPMLCLRGPYGLHDDRAGKPQGGGCGGSARFGTADGHFRETTLLTSRSTTRHLLRCSQH